VKHQTAIGKEAFSKRGELLRGKDEIGVKEKNSKDSDLEYGIVCCRNVDVEEGGYSMIAVT